MLSQFLFFCILLVFHTIDYAYLRNSVNCYTIESKDDNGEIFYGNIFNFLCINNNTYVVVRILDVHNEDFVFKSLSSIAAKHVHNYFKLVVQSDLYILICPVDIIRRCILLKIDNSLVLSPCVDLNEHN